MFSEGNVDTSESHIQVGSDDCPNRRDGGITCLIGLGAIGVLAATALGRGARDRLFLVGRPEQGPAIRSKGLRVEGKLGLLCLPPERFEFYDSMREVPEGILFSRVLIFVKRYANGELARQLASRRDLIGKETLLFCVQNGVDLSNPLVTLVPPEHIYDARVITGANRLAPNLVEVTAHLDDILIGSLAPNASMVPAVVLAGELHAGGLPARAEANIAPLLWTKLMFNAAVNGLTALHQSRIGDLAESKSIRPQLDRLLAEIFRISERAGRAAGFDTLEHWRDVFYNVLAPRSRDHASSMAADLNRDTPRPRTEVDYINGAFVALAAQHGLPAPENELIVACIHALEDERRRAKSPGREVSLRPKEQTA